MPSNIDDVVIVTVTKTTAAVSRQGFGTAMWMGQIDVSLQSERFKLYSSTQDLIDAGFSTTHPAYKWAQIHLVASPKPLQFALGRRVPGIPENDEVQITVADVGTWDADVNGASHTYVAGASDTPITIAAGLVSAVNAGTEPVVAVQQAAPNDDTFDITNIIGGGTQTVVITEPGVGASITTNTPETAPEAWATAYAAINTAANSEKWYYFNMEDRDDTTILAAAAQISTDEKIGIFQTRSAAMKAGTPGHIGLQLKALSYKRVNLFWKARDTDLSDARMAGVAAAADLDAAGGVITWNLKELVGVPVDVLSTSEKTNITDGGGSYYIEFGGKGRTQTQSVEGEFMRVQTTIDWTKARVQEDIFAVLGNTPTKVNLDSGGIASIEGALKGRLDIGVINGHYTADFNPTTSAPRPEDIDENDKNLGILRNVKGVARLAQAVRQVYVQVDLTV